MGFDVDSLRGDPGLVGTLRRQDRVHLCRHEACAEEGVEHFLEYGIARKFDPGRFQAAQASAGASSAGQKAWAWVWGSASEKAKNLAGKVREFASESEPEEVGLRCHAHLIRWAGDHGDERLSTHVCSERGMADEWLLLEDLPPGIKGPALCLKHANQILGVEENVHVCLRAVGVSVCFPTRASASALSMKRSSGVWWPHRLLRVGHDPGRGHGHRVPMERRTTTWTSTRSSMMERRMVARHGPELCSVRFKMKVVNG